LRLRLHDRRKRLGDPGKLTGVGDDHPKKPEIARTGMQIQNRPGDETQNLLHVTLSFDARRKSVLELTGEAEEHLLEDLLLGGELVVERPPGDASGLGQVI